MKNQLFTVIVLALSVACLISTDALALKAWEAGVKLGANGAKLRGDQVGLYVSLPPMVDVAGSVGDKDIGFVGGGYIRRNFSENFALQLETLYSQKGGKGNVYGTVQYLAPNNEVYLGEFNGELTVSLDYVEIPVLALFSFAADEKVDLVALGGVYLGFNTKAETRLVGQVAFPQPSFTSIVVDIDQKQTLSSKVETLDVGGVVGGGLEIETGNVILVFDARLTFGFTSTDKTGEKDVYNQVVSVFAGVGIPFGAEM